MTPDNATPLIPAQTFSVGEYLAEELQARGMTELEFANKLGWELPKTHWLICHNGLIENKEDAQAIARVLGTSVDFWLNLQSSHFDANCRDLWEAGMRPTREAQE